METEFTELSYDMTIWSAVSLLDTLNSEKIEHVFDDVISHLDSTLAYKIMTENNQRYMEITRETADIHSKNGGPLAGARVVIFQNGNIYFQVLHNDKEDNGNIFDENHIRKNNHHHTHCHHVVHFFSWIY